MKRFRSEHIGADILKRLENSNRKAQDTPFTTALRNMLLRGLLAPLRNSVVVLLCRFGLSRGEAITVGSLWQWTL